MEKYSSDSHIVNYNINSVFNALTNPARYKQIIEENKEKAPEAVRQHLDSIQMEEGKIIIQSPMGPVTLAVDNNSSVVPTRIVYTALNSPVKVALEIDLRQVDDNTTEETATLALDLPFFMAKMVAPKLKEGAEKFGQMLAMLPYGEI